jgi:hypothetical protein
LELKEDSIEVKPIYNKPSTIAIDNVHQLNFQTKRSNKFGKTLLGTGLGMLPGILYLSCIGNKKINLFEAVFVAPAEIGLGVGLVFGGAILGGILGNSVGHNGASISIPINGNKQLYEKQKEKIRQLAF